MKTRVYIPNFQNSMSEITAVKLFCSKKRELRENTSKPCVNTCCGELTVRDVPLKTMPYQFYTEK